MFSVPKCHNLSTDPKANTHQYATIPHKNIIYLDREEYFTFKKNKNWDNY